LNLGFFKSPLFGLFLCFVVEPQLLNLSSRCFCSERLSYVLVIKKQQQELKIWYVESFCIFVLFQKLKSCLFKTNKGRKKLNV
jgi:hypothetical protein